MRRARRGQATLEYLLSIAFIAVALGLAMGVIFSAVHGTTGRLSGSLKRDLMTGPAI
ncbi:MAG: hypothetical protein RLZZ299_639 [Pseudomonadota bacterium]|jgi:hypothetical protein